MSSLHPHPHLLPLQATTHPLLLNRLPSHRLLLHQSSLETTRQITLLPHPTRLTPQAQRRQLLPVGRRPIRRLAGRRLLVTRRTLLPLITTEIAACPASRSRSSTRTRLAECTAANAGPTMMGSSAATSGWADSPANLRKRLSRWKMQMDVLECKLLLCFSCFFSLYCDAYLSATFSRLSSISTAARSPEDRPRAMLAMIHAMLSSSSLPATLPARRSFWTHTTPAESVMADKVLEAGPCMLDRLTGSETVSLPSFCVCFGRYCH